MKMLHTLSVDMALYALLYQFLSCPVHLVSAVNVHHSDVKKLAEPTKDAIIVFSDFIVLSDNELYRACLAPFLTKRHKH